MLLFCLELLSIVILTLCIFNKPSLLFNELQQVTPAREEFCPSSGNLPPPTTPSPSATPTSTPITKPPTATSIPTSKAPSMDMPSTPPPTKKPSSKPPTSKKPSMSMGSGDIFDHFDLSGKSKKKKKEKKRRGMDERELDKMREDFRTLRRRDTVMEFGRPLQ